MIEIFIPQASQWSLLHTLFTRESRKYKWFAWSSLVIAS